MDIRMPILNGLDATKQIKELRPDLPVIAQTAYAMDGDRESSLAAGCNDYISKPINLKVFIQLIAKYLD
jgi:CheY-like chemotaxis protein